MGHPVRDRMNTPSTSNPWQSESPLPGLGFVVGFAPGCYCAGDEVPRELGELAFPT